MQTINSRVRPILRKIANLRAFRVIPEIRDFGIVAPKCNVTWKTPTAAVRELINKLRPFNCGKGLIRIGGPADGGYLIPDDLEGIEYCFSPGVNTISDFENQLADRGIRSFLADYSVEAPAVIRPEFTFDKKYLGSIDNEKFFTLASWKNKYLEDYSGDLLLQMDIEGGEYQVILNSSKELLDQFRVVVIEFHDLHRLFDPLVFGFFSAAFEKLLEVFSVVHIHPNNFYGTIKQGDIEIPRLMEFTFLNKRRITSSIPEKRFPNLLDAPNLPQRSNLHLPACWYGG
jgi:hypothetical protein